MPFYFVLVEGLFIRPVSQLWEKYYELQIVGRNFQKMPLLIKAPSCSPKNIAALQYLLGADAVHLANDRLSSIILFCPLPYFQHFG